MNTLEKWIEQNENSKERIKDSGKIKIRIEWPGELPEAVNIQIKEILQHTVYEVGKIKAMQKYDQPITNSAHNKVIIQIDNIF
jgi:hypothetical protein